jgi:adenylate kinase family enzyme
VRRVVSHLAMTTSNPARIVVLGASGNGKSTVGRRLAEVHGVPYIELDALHHGPNWTEASAEELTDRVAAAVGASDGWVVDGNYGRKIGDVVLERADLAVWLDQPLRVILPRIWRRSVQRIRDDVELWNGNKEKWRYTPSLLSWTIRSHRRLRRTEPERFSQHSGLRWVRLRSPREVELFVQAESVRAQSLNSGIALRRI